MNAYLSSVNPFIMESTNITPFVRIDPSGLFEMKGRSSPSSCINFYYTVIVNIEKTFGSSSVRITANFALEYFNSTSAKCLFDILRELKHCVQMNGQQLIVNWYYEQEDDDMLEAGEDLMHVLDHQFNFQLIKT